MSKRKSLIGRNFTRLDVFADGPIRIRPCGQRHSQSWCWCQCGNPNPVLVMNSALIEGTTGSCGCLHMELLVTYHYKHGHGKGNRIYRCWCNMRRRCYDPKCKQFDDWGGRGIRVCERWLGENGFVNFLADMGPGKAGWTIERVDNDGNYELSNCVWATRTRQSRNRRSNLVFTVRGITDCLMGICEHFGAPYRMILKRIRRGWSIERALFTPKM